MPDDALEMRFEFLMATDNVLEQQAERSAQMAVLDELDELATRIDVPLYTVRALLARSRRLFSDSDYGPQVETAQRAADLAAGAGLPAVEIEAQLWSGKGLTWDGRNDEAEAVLQEALAGARRTGERVPRGRGAALPRRSSPTTAATSRGRSRCWNGPGRCIASGATSRTRW